MVKCSFCGKEESPVRGIHLINNDGTISYFCSSKCRKNTLKLKRDRRKLKWTEAYRVARGKIVAAEKKASEKSQPEKPVAKKK